MLMLVNRCNASNTSGISISEASWNKETTNKNYIETYKESQNSEKDQGSSGSKTHSWDPGGLKYLFYILIGAAILFLIIKIIQNINSNAVIENTQSGKAFTLSEVEDQILEVDLDKFLKEALDVRDFRMALRINFLIMIKTLSLKGKIAWKKEKTNWEYVSEIRDPLMSTKFKEIVLTFESIWYGEHPFNEEQFAKLQPSYETFINTVAGE
jgi:hypothetical protein